MFENGRPRYWIDWYDPWYLLLPLLLVGVLAAIRWMPVSTPVRMAPTLPVVRTLSNQARLVVPLPPLAPTTLDLPLNGKGFYQGRMPDAEGRAEPGALVYLEYARLDLLDLNWRVLSQMPVDPTGRFHFRLENFPPGSFRLRVRVVTGAGRGAISGETMMTVLADPVRESRRRARK